MKGSEIVDYGAPKLEILRVKASRVSSWPPKDLVPKDLYLSSTCYKEMEKLNLLSGRSSIFHMEATNAPKVEVQAYYLPKISPKLHEYERN